METTIAPRKSLQTSFVTAEEMTALTSAFELALEDINHVAGGIPAVCACGCCVPVPHPPRPGPVLKM